MPAKPKLRLWCCDFWHPETEKYIRWDIVYRLLSERYHIELDRHSPQLLVYSCWGVRHFKYRCPRIFWTGENFTPNFMECDFSISFDADVAGRNHRYPLYAYVPNTPALKSHLARRGIETVLAEKQRFCSFIYSNPNNEIRKQFFHLLSGYKRVDAPGAVCNNMDAADELSAREAAQWHRSTIEFHRKYKFAIIFENASWPGYTTEKIRCALAAQTVPIYWGNPEIERDFNAKAIVNCHRYASFAEVVEAVREIDSDDRLYRSYLQAPAMAEGGQSASAVDLSRLLDAIEQWIARPPERLVWRTWRNRLLYRLPHSVLAKPLVTRYRKRENSRPIAEQLSASG